MILIVMVISMNSKVNWQLCRCVSTAWCNHSINNYTNPETIMTMMMMLVVSAKSGGGDDGRESIGVSLFMNTIRLGGLKTTLILRQGASSG